MTVSRYSGQTLVRQQHQHRNSSEQDVAESSADVRCNTELIGLPVEILTKIFTMKVGDTLEVYSTLVGIIE